MKKSGLLLLFGICSSLIMAGLLGASGCAVKTQEGVNETDEYPYYAEVHTFETSSLTVKLEEGQSFGAQLWAWKEDKLRFMRAYGWRVPAELVFYIEDPYGQRAIDAGRIEYTYEFAFTPEVSGDYRLIFDDSYGDCVVRIVHNSAEPLLEVSVP